MTSDTLFSPER